MLLPSKPSAPVTCFGRHWASAGTWHTEPVTGPSGSSSHQSSSVQTWQSTADQKGHLWKNCSQHRGCMPLGFAPPCPTSPPFTVHTPTKHTARCQVSSRLFSTAQSWYSGLCPVSNGCNGGGEDHSGNLCLHRSTTQNGTNSGRFESACQLIQALGVKKEPSLLLASQPLQAHLGNYPILW